MDIKRKIYISLVHHPVYNKKMEVITTSVTNIDLHDISRIAATYDVAKYYVVHPLSNHQKVIKDIIKYWSDGYGSQYNPDRKTAFKQLVLKTSIENVVSEITEEHGCAPKIITTDARTYNNSISYRELREEIQKSTAPFLIMFGTGWGLERETMEAADYILEPINGVGHYNHLSVRAAVAIIMDRLLGQEWWNK